MEVLIVIVIAIWIAVREMDTERKLYKRLRIGTKKNWN